MGNYNIGKLISLISVLLYSCTTYKIQEKWVFTESKYDVEKYNTYIEQSDLTGPDKQASKRIVDNLIYSENVVIDKKDDVSFNRNYIQINDSIKLEYFIFEPKKYLKSGIFFLGNGSNILYTYKKLEELSVETKSKVYVLNYRGYGKSEGTPSFKTVFEDNSSFLEFIKCTGNNIDFVIGYSLGSLSATYLATDNKINNLILLAPFSNTDDMFTFIKNKNTKGFKSIARPFVKFSAEDYLLNLSSTEKISMYNGRLVISHAVDDESLPFEMSKKLYYNCPSQQKELIEIDKRGHNAPFMNRYWEELISKLK